MPSLDAVEQFKSLVQGLAGEPEIRARMGLPPEEILPPESQLDDDLADLLGGMPVETGPDLSSEEPPQEDDPHGLEDLFAEPVPSTDGPVGPSLDDLLGPPSGSEADPFADIGLDPLEEPEPFEAEALEPEAMEPEPMEPEPLDLGDPFPADGFEEPEEPLAGTNEDLEALEEVDLDSSPGWEADPLDDLESFDPVADTAPRAGRSVSPEDMDDSFFQTPGPDLFGTETVPDDDLEFGEAMGDGDFPELAGFADTKEEDVEAFDANKEADEFQLGDFETQFGITADDHTDAELLNPAQAIDLEVEAAQKTLSLSDEEFVAVQRALGHLPLNLRLAIEELIGEKKDVAHDDIDKVLRLLIARAPVRSLASVVGKILGKKIVIPPGFEKGSGAELEARHGTLWYNLQTIMFPVLRVAAAVTVAAALLVLLGWNFLLKPWKANDLYNRGLVAARQDDGKTADELFAQAWYYWPVQDRFFQYAEAYQDTGDYDRARRKYLELLKPSVKPFRDQDKAVLGERYGKPLAPLPSGLEGQALADRLAAKRTALDKYYAYVAALLSSAEPDSEAVGSVPGEVILGNPDPKGILDYSRFETDFGFDGVDREAHFRRADAILKPLLAEKPGDKAGLLRKGDNQLAWSKALSSRENLDLANAAFSEYLRLYGYDAPVTWRFVRVFLLQDEESELLKFRDRIDLDKRLAVDGETMAILARWLIDREETVAEEERTVVPTQKTIEEEYGIRPKVVEAPEAPAPTHDAAAAPAAAAPAGHSLQRSSAAASGGGGHGGGGAEAPAAVVLTPPFKYPNSSQPFRPNYLDKVDTLLLRAMETQKSLPELHYQLSRFYRHQQGQEDERRALAAADTYFQRLEPRQTRLNDRPAMRVATSNRIGEIFEAMDQPLQAEKYYLDAKRSMEGFLAQGLVSLDPGMGTVYRNLGNLYYRQAPGVEAVGRGTVPGAWDQALKLFELTEKARLDDPTVTFRVGVIHYEKGEFALAVKRFFSLDKVGNRGEASGRDNPNLLYAMGNALFRSGNFASAEGYYRQLLTLLLERRTRIRDFDPAGRDTHRALAQRIYETWNNLAAAEYRAANTFRSGTPEFRKALADLTTARAQTQILGRDLYEAKGEFDVTAVDDQALQSIRDNEARIVALTRKEKGLVEANLQVLSLMETATPARKEVLADKLEIFARIPLELDQAKAP